MSLYRSHTIGGNAPDRDPQRPATESVVLPTFDGLPNRCPKCRAALSTTESYREFHGRGFSCYQKGQRIPDAEHIHWECRECRWSFATEPADAP